MKNNNNNQSQKAHILRIQNEREKNDSNSTSLANTLNANIQTALSGDYKFVLELLQNTDDAPILGKETSVQIIQVNGYLIYIHNGKPFSSDDVEKICDNAQDRYTDKSIDSNKTGYKGVGFKSIFSISKAVYIISGGYSFRFDEEHFAKKNTSTNKYPWPIIPVWTNLDQVPREVGVEIDKIPNADQATFFILKLRKQEDLQAQVNLFRNTPSNIIFLRNVNAISFTGSGISWKMRRERIDEEHVRIYINNTIVGEWLIKQYNFDIPLDIKADLQKLNNVECPQRLKNATTAEVTFAVEVKNNNLISANPGRFFSYLPTQMQSDIPVLINASFLLDYARTQLVENQWNKFLLEKIPLFIFQWMAELTKNILHAKQILKIFPPAELRLQNPWSNAAYKKGYDYARNNVAFLPEQNNPNSLIKLPQATYDSTNFYIKFPELKSQRQLVEGTLENIHKIKSLLMVSNIYDVIFHLSEYLSAYPDIGFELRIIDFFVNSTLEARQKVDLIKKFSLLSDENQLENNVANMYFKGADTQLPIAVEIKFVHPALYQNTIHKNFLKSLGVKDFDAIRFIQDHLLTLIRNGKIPDEKIALVHAFVLQHQDSINNDDSLWQTMKMLPLKTASGVSTLADRCYMPKVNGAVYNPFGDIFLDGNSYMSLNNDELKWRRYFTQLGATEQIKLRILPTVTTSEVMRLYPIIGKLYINYIKEKYNITAEEFTINKFPYIEFFDCIQTPYYAKNHLWPELLASANTLISGNSYIGSKSIVTIIQFIFREYAFIPNSAGGYSKSTELYSQSIDSNFHPHLLLATLPGEIEVKLEKYLGINTEINLFNCLNILNNLQAQGNSQNPLYELVFSRILVLNPRLTVEERAQISQWKGCLPAHNDTLQDKENLFNFALESVEINPSAYWLKRFRKSNFEMQTLANLFSIPTLKDNDTDIKPLNPQENLQLKETLLQRTHYLAIIAAKESGGDAKVLHARYQEIIAKISFYMVDGLCLSYKNKPDIQLQNLFACQLGNGLYVDKFLGISSRTITSISNFLAETLSLSGKTETLISSIVELDPDRLNMLLIKEGYTQDVIIKNTTNVPTFTQPIVAQLENEFDGMNITTKNVIENLSFEPSVDVKDLLISEVNITKLELPEQSHQEQKITQTFFTEPVLGFTPITVSPNRDMPGDRNSGHNVPNRALLSGIGKWAECCIFRLLREHYQKKFPTALILDTLDGFIFETQNMIKYRLIWHNIKAESGMPRDFTLLKGQEERVIEVKGSVNETGIVHIPESEWGLMLQYKRHYRLYRVSNVGKNNVKVAKIKDPAQAIQNNQLIISKLEVKM